MYSSSNRVRQRSQMIGLSLVLSASAGAGPPALPVAPSYPDHSKLLVVRDASGTESPVASASDWDVRRAHILAHLQEVMGPLPGGERRVPLDVRSVETFDEPTYVRHKITYASEPGDRVPAWLLVPKGGRGKAPAVLCLHQTTAIGKDEPAGLGGLPNLHYAKELAERGYVTLVPRLSGLRRIQGRPVRAGLRQRLDEGDLEQPPRRRPLMRPPRRRRRSDRGDRALAGRTQLDLRGALRPPAPGGRLVVRLQQLSAYYGGNIAGWSHKGYMPRLAKVYGLDLAKVPFDFPELVGALAPRAFFTNSPLRDANFAVEGVRTCIDSARPVYELLGASDRLRAVYPDAEHDFPARAHSEAYEFLDRVLKR